MDTFEYDELFINLTNNWELVYFNGLLDIQVIYNMEEPFQTLCNKYLGMVQNSVLPEVIKIIMEMDISDYILKKQE